jgi:hypothetical protein
MRVESCFVVAALLLLTPPALLAQGPARSFDQLGVLVPAGDKVIVTDRSGQEIKGRLVRLATEALTLEVDGQVTTLEQANVRLVRHRWNDPVLNGVLIGTAVGAGAGIAFVMAWCEETHECENEAAGAGVWALIGGGIGAGIGALGDSTHRALRTVYEAPAGAGGSVSIAPLVTPSRRGVALSVRF